MLTEPIDTPPKNEPTHIDDWIHRPFPNTDGEIYAQWVLLHKRLPASSKWKFERFMEQHKLYCTYKGKFYRVTGASRLGDVWLAEDLKRDTGYDLRVNVDECSGWTPNAWPQNLSTAQI